MAFIVQLCHVCTYVHLAGRTVGAEHGPTCCRLESPSIGLPVHKGERTREEGGCESLIGAAFDSAGLMDRQETRLRRGSKVAARLVAPAPPRQALETPEEAAEAQECRERHKNVAGRAGQRYQLAVSPRRDPTAMATILRAVSGGMCRVID